VTQSRHGQPARRAREPVRAAPAACVRGGRQRLRARPDRGRQSRQVGAGQTRPGRWVGRGVARPPRSGPSSRVAAPLAARPGRADQRWSGRSSVTAPLGCGAGLLVRGRLGGRRLGWLDRVGRPRGRGRRGHFGRARRRRRLRQQEGGRARTEPPQAIRKMRYDQLPAWKIRALVPRY